MPENIDNGKNTGILLIFIFISLLCKSIIILNDQIINPDGAIYITAANLLANGHLQKSLTVYPMPFYPFLLALGHWLIPNWVIAGQAIAACFLTITLLPLFWLAKEIFDHQTAVATCLLYLVLPIFNLPCADIMREPPFLMFAITAIWLGRRALISTKLRDFFWFNILTLLAFLCRLEALILPIVFLCAWGITLYQQPAKRPALLRGILTFLLLPLGLTGCWWLGKIYQLPNFNRLGEIKTRLGFSASQSFFATYIQITTAMKKLQQVLPGSNLANNLLEVSRHYAPLIYLIGIFELFAKAIFPTTIILLLLTKKKFTDFGKSSSHLLLLLFFTYLMLIFLININQNFIVERMFLLPILIILPWAGKSLAVFFRHYRLSGKKIGVIIICIFFLGLPLGKTILRLDNEETVLKKAGTWLHEYGQHHQFTPVYNDPRLPFYAGRLAEVMNYNPRNYELISNLSPQTNFIAFYLAPKKISDLPPINGFSKLREFSGVRHQVLIFIRRSPDKLK